MLRAGRPRNRGSIPVGDERFLRPSMHLVPATHSPGYSGRCVKLNTVPLYLRCLKAGVLCVPTSHARSKNRFVMSVRPSVWINSASTRRICVEVEHFFRNLYRKLNIIIIVIIINCKWVCTRWQWNYNTQKTQNNTYTHSKQYTAHKITNNAHKITNIISFSLKSDRNIGYLTRRRMNIYDSLSLNSENEKCFRQKLYRKSKHALLTSITFSRKPRRL